MPDDAEILRAAWPLFVRFGFRKLSMTEIARAASISRPTLYAAFGSKEDIFRAAVAAELEEIKRTTHVRLEDVEGLESQLRTILELWFVTPVSEVLEGPSGDLLLEDVNRVASDEIADSYVYVEQCIADTLQAEATDLSEDDALGLAEVVVFACRGAKATGALDVLERVSNGVVDMVCRVLDGR